MENITWCLISTLKKKGQRKINKWNNTFLKRNQVSAKNFTLDGGAEIFLWDKSLSVSETELSDGWCIRLLLLRSKICWFFSGLDEVASCNKKSALSLRMTCVSDGVDGLRRFTVGVVVELEDTFLLNRFPLSSLRPKASPTCLFCCKYRCRQSSHNKYHELPYTINIKIN